MMLEHTFTLRNGDGEAVGKYDVIRMVFHHGVNSEGGHYSVAVRVQANPGTWSEHDSWQHLDSAQPIRHFSLAELNLQENAERIMLEFPRMVTGMLLVAQTPPQGERLHLAQAPPVRYVVVTACLYSNAQTVFVITMPAA